MLDTHNVSVGQVVTSIAGRDKERKFIICQIVDDHYVKVVDGDLRRVENPKLKKIKHLNVSSHVIDELSDSVKGNRKLTNERVRKLLENFIYYDEGGM